MGQKMQILLQQVLYTVVMFRFMYLLAAGIAVSASKNITAIVTGLFQGRVFHPVNIFCFVVFCKLTHGIVFSSYIVLCITHII